MIVYLWYHKPFAEFCRILQNIAQTFIIITNNPYLMAEIPKVHRVNADDLKVGAVVEQREHPWASPRTAKRIARDHLKESPGYYSMGGGGKGQDVNVTLAQNVKAIAPRKKKKQMPQPKDTGPSWIPRGMRLYG